MIEQNAHLELQLRPQALSSMKEFVLAFTKEFGLKENIKITSALEELSRLFLKNNEKSFYTNTCNLDLSTEDNKLLIKLVNKGVPIFDEKSNNFKELQNFADSFYFENLGRKGQVFELVYDTSACEKKYLSSFKLKEKLQVDAENLEFRPMKLEEVSSLSKLFYQVYGYNYINDDVYYPERLKKMIKNKNLISFIAASKDRPVGHIALLALNEDKSSYECALGIVDPRIKSKGTFKNLFGLALKEFNKLNVNYCLYGFVTNHDFSQREVFKYPTCEMSIHVGSQVSENQAKLETLGLGHDAKDMDRYSILMAIKANTPHPFGKHLTLPISVGERLDFLLKPLGVDWTPASRFFPAPYEGLYEAQKSATQRSVVFYMDKPGQNILEKIVNDWKYWLRMGYLYAAVDIPLQSPGVGQIHDFFSKNGFFISGLVPYRKTCKLALRLQALGPTRVSWDSIKIFSERGKILLKLIQDDYKRHGKI